MVNLWVLTSSGTEIQVSAKFRCMVSSGAHSLGEVVFYIVEDSVHADICCDVVLGRSTLARSVYSHIDTVSGCLINPVTSERIWCVPAVVWKNVHDVMHVLPANP